MRFVDVGDLHWALAGVRGGVACTLCGHVAGNFEVMRVLLPGTGRAREIAAHRCAACASISFDPGEILSYDTFGAEADLAWRHYLEIGAGLYEMIWPAAIVEGAQGRSLLEVGCGFGFTLDFWRRQMNASAVGVETAHYGAMGAKALGVEIHAAYLQEVAELQGRRFDLISGSEVIEHVPEPRAFLHTIREHLNAGGVLVLTTPNAAFVTEGSDPSVVLAAVSAGFHAYLLSASALETLLRDAGFAHVLVREYNERLIAWASDAPIRLQDGQDAARRSYLQYLFGLYQRLPADSALFDGIAYRTLKETVNIGEWDGAKAAVASLERRLVESWGRAVLEPEQVFAVSNTLGDFDDLGRNFPYFLPVYYYYRGVVARHEENDMGKALRYFQGAHSVGRLWSALASPPQLETIGHIWIARLQQISTLIAIGSADRAVRLLGELFSQRGRCAREFGYAIARPDFVESALIQAFVECVGLKRHPECAAVSEMIDTLLAERYGPAAPGRTPAGMAPMNRLWVHFCRAEFERNRKGGEPAAAQAQGREAAALLAALPESVRGHPGLAQVRAHLDVMGVMASPTSTILRAVV